MGNKVLLIGLDGASFNILMPWIRKGFLPMLKRLIEKGVYSILKSTIPPDSPPAWTSIFTGKNPGKHGVYGFLDFTPQLDEKSKKYVFRVVNSRCRRSLAIWNILSKEGRRVIVINAPLTYPPEPVNGVMISGFLTPDLKSNFVYPRWLKPILVKKGYRIGVRFGEKEFSMQNLVENIRARVRIAKWLMRNFDWDLFIIVFMETDQVMHVHNDIRKALRIYQEVDNGISTLIKELPSKSYVVLVSDHGFKKFRRNFYLNTFLWKRSLLKLKINGAHLYSRLLTNLIYTFSDNILNISLVGKFKDFFFRATGSKTLGSSLNLIDYANSFCYNLLSGTSFSTIRFNVKHREPAGIVNKSSYDYLVKYLAHELKKTGIVKNVFRKDEIYWGPFLENAPDLVVQARDEYLIKQMLMPTISLPSNTYDHFVEGIFIAYGPNVKRGCKLTRNNSVIDVAPTILELMGINTPKDMDGRAIGEVLEE